MHSAEVEAAILTGGESRRMGREKAALALAGVSFLERVTRAAAPLVGRTRLIGIGPGGGGPSRPSFEVQPDRRPGLEVQPDRRPGLGPLSGIVTALETAEAPNVLVVACDLPLVTTAFLELLLRLLEAEVDAVVPRSPYGLVPVCAVYRARAVEPLSHRLEAGERAPHRALRSVPVRVVDPAEIARVDPDGRCLMNVNTPEDYERVRRLVEDAPPR